MSLWFLPLATALADAENLSKVSGDCYKLFQVYTVLQSILDGTVTVKETGNDWSSNREFTTSSGWKFIVFDDCGEWDYIDNVITPKGVSLCEQFGWDYLECNGTIYDPTPTELREIWNWNKEDNGQQ